MRNSIKTMLVTEVLLKVMSQEKDRCQICKGSKGGVRGNENVIDGKLVCDYCHADMVLNQQAEGE